jgi:hypothetical protein
MMRTTRTAIVAAALWLGALAAAAAQQLPQKVWTLQSPVVPLGYCSLAVPATTATSLSGCPIPSAPAGTLGPVVAIASPVAPVTFRDDGTAPTSGTPGFPLVAAQLWTFTTNPLSNVQFWATAATSVNVLFYAVR